jgi:signal transduction histidine kinase
VTWTGETGSGLGWSIAKRIAQVHGLRLAARRSPLLGGLSVLLTHLSPTDYNSGDLKHQHLPS